MCTSLVCMCVAVCECTEIEIDGEKNINYESGTGRKSTGSSNRM